MCVYTFLVGESRESKEHRSHYRTGSGGNLLHSLRSILIRTTHRQQTPTQREKDAPAGPSPHMPADGKARDFSLKPGESIGAISFGGQKPKTTSSSLLGSGSSSGGGSILLPPPPSAKDVRRRMG